MRKEVKKLRKDNKRLTQLGNSAQNELALLKQRVATLIRFVNIYKYSDKLLTCRPDSNLTLRNFEFEIVQQFNPLKKSNQKNSNFGRYSEKREGGAAEAVELDRISEAIEFYSGDDVEDEILEEMLENIPQGPFENEAEFQDEMEKYLKQYCLPGSENHYKRKPKSDTDPRIPDGAFYSKTICKNGLNDDVLTAK